tara:strand:+ start:470 stop:775 length:306 start_codon:yes stop_codon:yes gene_type:complete
MGETAATVPAAAAREIEVFRNSRREVELVIFLSKWQQTLCRSQLKFMFIGDLWAHDGRFMYRLYPIARSNASLAERLLLEGVPFKCWHSIGPGIFDVGCVL